MSSNAQLLQLAIATPLLAAAIIACGLPKRFATKLAAVAFTVPAVLALWLWSQYPAEGGQTYSFLSTTFTGLQGFGITLKLGLNGIALPMFLLSATFWLWAWGPVGGFIAVPSLLILQSTLEHVLPGRTEMPRKRIRRTANMSPKDVVLANAAQLIKEKAEAAAKEEEEKRLAKEAEEAAKREREAAAGIRRGGPSPTGRGRPRFRPGRSRVRPRCRSGHDPPPGWRLCGGAAATASW